MHYYSEKPDCKLEQKKINIILRGNKLELLLSSGVFSKSNVDKGTQLLIQSAIIQPKWKILDFGCGNGIVGIAIAKAYPDCGVLLSDVNERALETAQKNILLNNLKNAKAVKSDMFENIKSKFDAILLNPPQTAGKEICFQMIEESKQHLNKSGLLQFVAREKKGGKALNNKMNDIFKNCLVIGESSGYNVYAGKNV